MDPESTLAPELSSMPEGQFGASASAAAAEWPASRKPSSFRQRSGWLLCRKVSCGLAPLCLSDFTGFFPPLATSTPVIFTCSSSATLGLLPGINHCLISFRSLLKCHLVHAGFCDHLHNRTLLVSLSPFYSSLVLSIQVASDLSGKQKI